MIFISLNKELERALERYDCFCKLPEIIIYDFIIGDGLSVLLEKFNEKIKNINQIKSKVIILINENSNWKGKSNVLRVPQSFATIWELEKNCGDAKEEMLFNYFIENVIKFSRHLAEERSEFFNWFTKLKGAYKIKGKTLDTYYDSIYFNLLEKMCLIDKKAIGDSRDFKSIVESISNIKNEIIEIRELEMGITKVLNKRDLSWRNVIF